MNTLVRQIALLSVLWAVCEMLLPDGKHQHMVRMVASLLVITALLTTVNSWPITGQSDRPSMTMQVQQASEDSYRRTALTAMANQIQRYCEQMAERAGYAAVASVFLTTEGALDHIQLVLSQQENVLISPLRLAALLAEQFGVEERRILVSTEGT